MSEYPIPEKYVSGDEDGPTVGWLWHVDADHSVWCGEISRTCFEEASAETQDAMGNDFGWFLVLYSKTKKIILGKAPDEYLGRDLAETIALGLIANPKMAATLLQDAK